MVRRYVWWIGLLTALAIPLSFKNISIGTKMFLHFLVAQGLSFKMVFISRDYDLKPPSYVDRK